ncbi:MAG: histidine kinase [Saprospiraceae bacterium]
MPPGSPVEKKMHATLRQWGGQLAQWAFTDFTKAKEILALLEQEITPQTAFDIRLTYHRHNGFLQNQWQHYDAALAQFDQAAAILEALSDSVQLAEIWADRAAVYVNQRNWSATEECLERGRKLVKGPQSRRLKAQFACREGFLHLHLRNERQALDALQEARRLLEGMGAQASLKDRYIFTLVLSGLGDLYERLEDKERSLDAYRHVLLLLEKYQLKPRLAWHYVNAGRIALAQQDEEEAIRHFQNAVRTDGEGDLEAKVFALSNLAILAFINNQPAESESKFDEALSLFRHPDKPSDFSNLAKLETWKANLLLRQGDIATAERHFLQAYEHGLRGADPLIMRQICQALGELYGSRQSFSEAFHWQNRALHHADQHFKERQHHERQELEARYQLERNRQEARLAKLQVAGLQMRALRAQMNPHFLFNVLNAIQGLITSGRDSEAETYLARFAKLIRQSLDYSDLEVVTLEQEIEFIGRYLEINKKLRFRDQLEFRIVPPPDADPEEIKIPTMIVQPFVENAIEHGLRPRQSGLLTISFQLSPDERALLCAIEDDGVGYNKGKEKQAEKGAFQTHRSRGMEITRDRLTLLHQLHNKNAEGPCVHIIDRSSTGEEAQTGTRVEVRLPLLGE